MKVQDVVISGHVTDSMGALVPGAHIELRPAKGSIGLSTVADSAGYYIFFVPDSGMYVMLVDSSGFAPFQSGVITLESGKTRSLDIHLTVAEQVQQIDVPSDGGTDTDPNENSTAFVLKGRALEDLPLDPGQLTQELNALAGSDSPELRINGFSNGRMPPRDSIREIRINQNPYSAQNDTNPVNGMVEVFTKPGGDQFHGTFYVYGSGSALNALSPFVTEAPAYHSINTYGNLGGPLSKHTSFFTTGNYTGDDTNSVINAQKLDANLLPVNITQAVGSPSSASGFSTRIDTSAGKKSTLTFNYTWNKSSQTNGGIGNLSLLDQGFASATTNQVLQASNSQVINAKIVNDTRFQYIRTRVHQTVNSSAPSIIVQGAFNDGGNNLGNFRDNQDQYELQNYVSLAAGKHFLNFGGRLRVGRDANRSEANYNGQFIFANLTIPTDLGSMPLSSVSSYQKTRQNIEVCEQDHASSDCLDILDLRKAGGGPSQFTQTTGNANVAVTLTDAGLFLQDDWKALPNLTLSAGLRYETQNHISDHGDWAPRFGFAYGFGGANGKPKKYTLRGGAGIFYKRFASSNVLDAERQNGITQSEYVVNAPDFFTVPAARLTDSALKKLGSRASSATFQISPVFRAPYYLSSTISLQRSVGSYGRISASYLFNRGVHSQLTRNINAPLPGTYNPTDPSSGTRPLGGNRNIYQYESNGVFSSNRFSTNYFLNVKSRFLLYGYYMLRNDKTDTNGGFPSNQYDVGADYGRSSADVRQSVQFGGNATLPWDIQPAIFVIANSGAPFNIVVGQDLNGDSQFNDRPSFATDLSRSSVVKTKYGTFDTNPIAGQKIIPNYYGRGFGQLTVNLSFRKGFNFGPAIEPSSGTAAPKAKPSHVARKYNVSFYLFAENALNTVNLAPPVGTLNSPLFGKAVALSGNSSTSANRTLILDMAFRF